MQNNVLSTESSTWRSRLRALGPGVWRASAAVGGSPRPPWAART